MTALTFNGITLPNAARSFKEVPEWVGDVFERSVGGDLGENFVARKRKWSCSVIAQTLDKADVMRRYLEGEGLTFSFDTSTYADRIGEGPAAGGTYTQSAGSAKYGAGKVNVGSGSFLGYDLKSAVGRWVPSWTASLGWTLAAWKKLSVGDGGDGSTYHHHLAKGAVAVIQGASGNPANVKQYKAGALGSFSMGNWIELDNASAGLAKIWGYDNAAAAAAYDYEDLVLLPYEIDDAWPAQIFAFVSSFAHPPLPFVRLGGTLFKNSGAGVLVRIRAMGAAYEMRKGSPVCRLDLAIAEA